MNKCQFCFEPFKLKLESKVYSCRCGLNCYAICRCCSAVCTPSNVPTWFIDLKPFYKYRLRCASCGDTYCPHCANSSFYATSAVVEKKTLETDDDGDDDSNHPVTDICHQCTHTKEYKVRQSELQQLTFSHWSITYHVAVMDREQQLHTHVTICPHTEQRLELALKRAQDYVGTLFATRLDADDVKSVHIAVQRSIDAGNYRLDNMSLAATLTAQCSYDTGPLRLQKGSATLTCVIVISPSRSRVVRSYEAK